MRFLNNISADKSPLLHVPISPDKLHVGQYEHLLHKVTTLTTVSIVLALSVGFLLRDNGHPVAVGIWVFLAVALPAVTIWNSRKSDRENISPKRARKGLKKTYLYSFTIGVVWGGSAFVFSNISDDIYYVLLALVVTGMTAGLSATVPAVPFKSAIFAVTAIPPPFWNLLEHGSEQSIGFVWMMTVFLMAFFCLAITNYARFKSSLQIKLAFKSAHVLLDDAIENMGEGFAIYSGDGSILYANQMYQDLFSDVNMSKIPPAGDSRIETLADGRIIKSTTHLTLRGHLVRVLRDITRARKQEEALLAARLGAESANRAKSQFLTVMSHELRTPLNAIIGFSELISREDANLSKESVREFGGYIKQSGTELLRLISQILDMSRIEAGRFDLSEEAVNLTTLVHKVVNASIPLANDANVQIAIQVDEETHLWADENALRQILFNLITNAIKFSHEGGVIHVKITCEDGRVGIEVSDEGIGISPDEMELIFNPFYQSDNTLTRKREGSGLGLPLVHNLVTLHSGDISVKSEHDRGTCISVSFPPERRIENDNDARLRMVKK